MGNDKIIDASIQLRSAKRLVVKIGSALLCDEAGGVRRQWLESLADDVAKMRKKGCDVVIVSSGAIALGRGRLGLQKALRLDEKQAASAAGQSALAQAWQAAFDRHDIKTAQILLTLEDTENRRRYLNARSTFRTLLDLQAIPLVNENDTVATSEIRYGDNDRLAAHVAQLVEADTLVILSDVDGVYTADPNDDPGAKRIDVIDEITPAIEAAAVGPNKISGTGAGGMASKIAAAKIAGANGCATIIAPGGDAHPLFVAAEGGVSTLIRPSRSIFGARRQWIGGRLKPTGRVCVDAGAMAALLGGASLLPAGIKQIEGNFSRGDTVLVIGPEGNIIAQGLSSYHSSEIEQIKGKRSEELESILGYCRRPAVIEKNDLVLRSERG